MRDNAGALKQEVVQAQNRTDALTQIRKLGGVPVSVTENEQPGPSFGGRRNMRLAGVGAGCCLAAVAALIFWRWPRNVTKTRDRDTLSLKKVDSTAVVSPPTRLHVDVSGQNDISSEDRQMTDRIVKPRLSAEEKTKPVEPPVQNESGQTRLPVQPGGSIPVPPQPKPHSYKSATEGLLSMALSTKPGEMMPPMPIAKNLDEDFANSLTNTIVIYEDDDERTAALKENVAVAKMELLELVRQGKSVSEALKEFQDNANKQAELREQAQRELAELRKTATPQQVEEYLNKINDALNEMGIEPIQPRSIRATP